MRNIIRDTRFWVAIGLLCLLIVTWVGSGLLRVGDPPEGLGLAARILLILAVGVIVGAVYFAANLASGRANQRVMGDIAETGPGAESKLTEEEQQLQAKFREASARISKLRFGKVGARKHLHQLPWYIVVGSPGSGKTTAIKKSGLEFPLDDITQGGSLGGVGGTRNCDWWVTEQAVLLDTAGRYTKHDSDAGNDAKGWKNFLSLLRKHRKRQPLNGAILIVSTEELLHMNDEQWKAHAQTVTRRLHELAEELQMSFPVYLVVTKVDLLAGCREFFDKLESEEQEQIWGTTLSADEDISVIGGQLQALAQRLHEQLPSKLRYDRDVKRRRAIYSFPWQLEAVSSRIDEFVRAVFSHHSLVDEVELRGVYFSSAVQEGTPIERLVGGVATGFGISGGQLSTKTGQSRSLFLHKLFPDVVFREAFLAGTNTSHEKNMQRLRLAAFAAIIIAGVGLALIWSSAFGVHRTLLGEARAELAEFENAPNGPDRTLSENLAALVHLERSTRVFSQQEHPWLSTLGMYEDSIDEASKEAYTRAVGTLVAPTIGSSILAALDAYPNADYQLRFNALKAYLMLANRERRNDEWLVEWVGANSLGELQGENAAASATHLEQLFLRDPDYQIDVLDQEIVERHQRRLAGVPNSRQLYSRLMYSLEGESIDFTNELGPYFLSTFSVQRDDALEVPYPFTVSGYESLSFGPQSDWVLSWLRDRWVLGESSPPGPVELARNLEETKQLYAREYVDTWSSVLQGVDLSSVSGEQLSNTLMHLAEPALSPMSLLLELVVRETTLPSNESSKAAVDAVMEMAERRSRVARAAGNLSALAPQLVAVPIADVVQEPFIEYRYMAEGGIASKKSRVTKEIGDVRRWLRQAQSGGSTADDQPVAQLLLTSEELTEPFASWVSGLALAVRDSAGAGIKDRINAQWRREVTEACVEAFRGRFPFYEQAESSVNLASFDDYFKPGGIENSFVRSELAPAIEEHAGLFDDSTRWTIRQGERVRDAFYSNGNDLGFSYALTGVDVDQRIGQVIIESGEEQAVRYRHGPPVPLDLKWPDGDMGIRITYMLKDGSRQRRVIEGPWAIFRLAQSSSLGRAAGGEGMLVSLGQNGYRAVFRLTADTRVSPFSAGLLSKYQCRDAP